MEIWKDIKEYEELYKVSNLGNIKSCKNNDKILKQCSTGRYLIVHLSKNGISKNFYVHRLVASCFIENINNKNQVNHKDGNRLNNNSNNLEWVSSKENVNHAIDIGLTKRKGEFNSNSFLTEKEVLSIRDEIKTNSTSYLAKKYKVKPACISKIILKKTWKHI